MKGNELRVGMSIRYEGEPYTVIFWQLRQQPRTGAVYITKLKHLFTKNTLEKTFRENDSFEPLDLSHGDGQFLYKSGEHYVFMDNKTYEQFEFLPEDLDENVLKFLADGGDVMIMYMDEKAVTISLPKTVILEVVETVIGDKGDSASGRVTKPAKLSSGAEIPVPQFVKEGDKIKVNTDEGTYIERV